MRDGIKTTEFWLGAISTLFIAIQQYLWPDHPFPKEAFLSIGFWIVARIGEKSLGPSSPTKRAWMTSEFWVSLVYSIIKYIYPELPDDIFYMACTWIFGRPITKITKNISLTKDN